MSIDQAGNDGAGQPLEESLPAVPRRLRVVPAEHMVRLDDLLRTVRLTPRQVAWVAVEVLRDLVARHARGESHGAVAPRAVQVGIGSGKVRLDEPRREENPEDWLLAPAVPDGPAARRADLAAAAAMLTALVEDARTPAAAHDSRAVAVLGALEEVVTALRDKAADAAGPIPGMAGTPTLNAQLATLSLVAEPRGRYNGAPAELAALAVAAGGTARGAAEPPPKRACAALPRQASGKGTRSSVSSVRAVARRGMNRLTVMLLAVAALGAVISLEFTFLGDKLGADLRLLTGREEPEPAVPPAAASRRAPAPLPVLGPAAAGPLTAVHLRAVGGCAPRQECLFRVIAAVRPRAVATTVHWKLTVVDRCRGTRTAGPSGTLGIPPRTGTGSTLTRLSAGRGILAVVALTDRPARAASSAVPVPVDPPSC
jgi:hypothetical protein